MKWNVCFFHPFRILLRFFYVVWTSLIMRSSSCIGQFTQEILLWNVISFWNWRIKSSHVYTTLIVICHGVMIQKKIQFEFFIENPSSWLRKYSEMKRKWTEKNLLISIIVDVERKNFFYRFQNENLIMNGEEDEEYFSI